MRRTNSSWNILHRVLLLLPFAFCLTTPVARSEGSRELNAFGGYRPFLEYREGTCGLIPDQFCTSQIPRRTTIKVYVNPDEVIDLGSSAIGIGAGDIVATPPVGPAISCDTEQPGTGFIVNRAAELAGPNTVAPLDPNAFIPCSITVGPTQGGVWDIEFVSPNRTLPTNPTAVLANNNWAAPNANDSFVAAWDVTVRSDTTATTALPGRAFANFLALNPYLALPAGPIHPVNSRPYVLTEDGYTYQIDLNGQQPAAFIFFANKNGFLDGPDGNPLFRSVELADAEFERPHLAGNDEVTHKIFFNTPAVADFPNSDAIPSPGGFTWLRNQPAPPPSPSDFTFVGIEDTPGQMGTNPLGGNFRFNSTGEGTYRLIIDANGDGIYGNNNDVILQGRVNIGSNTVAWDGTDANGNPLPAGPVPYGATIQFYGGEVHFPFLDVEENNNGLIVTRLTEPPGFPPSDPTIVYYDDSDLAITQPYHIPPALIATGLEGVSSAGGAHEFGGIFPRGWGDERGIDTWVLFPSPPFELEQGILIAEADLKITKTRTPDPAIAGGNITYTITVTNAGPSNIRTANPARVSDIFTANGEAITNLTWTCEIIPPANPPLGAEEGTCIDESGTNNLTNAQLALDAGFSAQYTLTGTIIPTATQDIVNQAIVTRPNDVADPINDDNDQNNDNNRTETATVTVPLTPGNPLIGVAKAAGTPIDNGDRTFTIPYTLVVRNYGNLPLTNLQVTENFNDTFTNIPYSLEPNSLTSPTLAVNPNFNGNTNTNLLEVGNPNNSLAVDTEATINFAVRVTPGNNLGPFNNQVTASGVTPGGTEVNDLSTNGANPLGNNNTTGDPTQSNEITSVTLRGNPNLELEKRITRINGTVVGQSESLPNWPTNFVRGITNPNNIQPGDEVEYTIYFLSTGTGPLDNAIVCDPLQNYQTFRTDTFNGQAPIEGTFGAEVGIALALNPFNPDVPTAYLRSANSASNRGRFYPSGTATPLICQPNIRGAVVVEIGNLGVGDYGFIRFRVRID